MNLSFLRPPDSTVAALCDDDPRHGTLAGHAAGCRCDACDLAKLRYDKRRKLDHATGKPRRAPAWPTVRRIRALQALGHSLPAIADAAGLNRRSINNPTFRGETVYVSTAHGVDKAYRALCMTRPEGFYADRGRRAAARKGWAPPLAWDDIDDPTETPPSHQGDGGVDPVVVERVLGGEFNLSCTAEERLEVIAQWQATGRTLKDLERSTGWNVHRIRRAA